MIYQLPNGKIINISLEDYLSLDDDELMYLYSCPMEDPSHSPWMGSVLLTGQNKRRSSDHLEDEEDEEYLGSGYSSSDLDDECPDGYLDDLCD